LRVAFKFKKAREMPMKAPVALLTLVVEIAFIVYCIHMTYLLDVLDPFPREWLIPNALIGGAILLFGYFVASWLNRDLALTERKWSNTERE